MLGQSQVRGIVRLPANGPIVAELNGSVLDLAPRFTARAPRTEKPREEPKPGPAWTLDGRFDRVLLAGGQAANGVVARARNDGRGFRVLSVTGQTAPAAPFSLEINPGQGRRQLTGRAADAGALLRGLDIVRTLDGGQMSIDGWYDDSRPSQPLNGTARIEDFRVRGSVGLGKLLQAMTLYGLVDVLRGPGIGFTRLLAPFQLEDDVLYLNDARAFSPSLGMTAKGRLDLASDQADVEGTIVPAYFFNSLLGNIPLLGKLFSPEAGGGVFAARYAVRGRIDDPNVSVNPLSALAPGFLRDLFSF
jgi:hypothetical protein